MQKVITFLENYVQWIALGLGALFLGYCIYDYALQTPVMVAGVGGSTPLNPGDVDKAILDGPAHKIDLAMRDPNVPVVKVPDFVTSFVDDLRMTDYKPAPLAMIVSGPTQPPASLFVAPQGPSTIAPVITALPTLAAATVLDFSTGRSNVQLVGAPAAPTPAGSGAVPVAGGVDKSWVTIRYAISPKELDTAFAKANVPPWTNRTALLQVVLNREEMLPNGQWSQPQPIEPLNEAALIPYPETNNLPAEQAYLGWAPQHVLDLLQPAFLVVNRGDPWMLPGQVNNAAPAGLPPLDPAKTYPANILLQYSVDERRAYAQAHEALRQQQQPQRRPSGGLPGVAPPRESGGPQDRGVVEDPDREKAEANPPYYQALPPGFSPQQGPPRGSIFEGQISDQPGGGFAPPGSPNGGMPNNPNGPVAPNSLPPNEFDPKQISGDIIGWQHDITVDPGHVYRYMVVYKIKNPIFNTSAAKNNPQLAKVFDLISADSNWSQPVSIATSTNFFVASNSSRNALGARFRVFKWEAGSQREHDFEVAPGDEIGSKLPDGDFSTGYTLVALRFDDPRNPDQMTAMVMQPDGQIVQRDYRTDQARPELQNLINQAQAASAAAAGGAPNGGSPPPGGPTNGGAPPAGYGG